MGGEVKFLLMALLTVGLLPGGPELVVEGGGPECVATAVGDVETFLVVYYDDNDAANISSPSTYTTHVGWLPSGATSVLYDWMPVAAQWYGRPVGGDRFKLLGGCGRIPPKDITRDPRNTTPLEECPLMTTEPMELYARAYYLHPHPDDPSRRYFYKSETIVTEEAGEVVLGLAFPIGVAWYYRQCGSLAVFPSGNWILAKTCGEVEAPMPIERFMILEETERFALGGR